MQTVHAMAPVRIPGLTTNPAWADGTTKSRKQHDLDSAPGAGIRVYSLTGQNRVKLEEKFAYVGSACRCWTLRKKLAWKILHLVLRVGRIDRADNNELKKLIQLPVSDAAKVKAPESAEKEITYKLKAVVKHKKRTEDEGRFDTYVVDQVDCVEYSEKGVEHLKDGMPAKIYDYPDELSHLTVLRRQDEFLK